VNIVLHSRGNHHSVAPEGWQPLLSAYNDVDCCIDAPKPGAPKLRFYQSTVSIFLRRFSASALLTRPSTKSGLPLKGPTVS